MTTTLVANAKARAEHARHTYGYLSAEYRDARRAWHRAEDALAEQQRREMDELDPGF